RWTSLQIGSMLCRASAARVATKRYSRSGIIVPDVRCHWRIGKVFQCLNLGPPVFLSRQHSVAPSSTGAVSKPVRDQVPADRCHFDASQAVQTAIEAAGDG